MVKKIEDYSKPQLPNKKEFLNSKKIVSVVSAGLITLTLGCSGNAKLVDSAETSKNIGAPSQALNDTTQTTYPNPFMPTTTIEFHVAQDSTANIDFKVNQDSTFQHVLIEMFNAKGDLVRTLVDTELEAGIHSVSWDGLDDAGNKAESGIYFYRLTVDGNEISTEKMILMK